MKVADIMTKQVDTVTTEMPIGHIAQVIFGRGIRGAPVCKGKKIIGFITERDILSQFYPTTAEYLKDPHHAGDFERMEEKTQKVFALKAGEIMSKKPATIVESTPILQAMSKMFIYKVGVLPVIDHKGNLVGIITKGDIFRALVGEKVEEAENQEYNDWLSRHFFVNINWKSRMSHEIPDLTALLHKHNAKKILEIGSHVGRHATELAKEGFDILGIERSGFIMQTAEKKRATLGQDIKERIHFLHGEYVKTLQNLQNQRQQFDAAIFMGDMLSLNPYNYEDVLKETLKVLVQHAPLVFQMRNYAKIVHQQKRFDSLSFIEGGAYKEQAYLRFFDAPAQDGTIKKTFALFDNSGKSWKYYGLKSTTWAYLTKEKIASLLKKFGITDVSYFGASYDMKEYDYLFRKSFKETESDWLNVIAIKP